MKNPPEEKRKSGKKLGALATAAGGIFMGALGILHDLKKNTRGHQDETPMTEKTNNGPTTSEKEGLYYEAMRRDAVAKDAQELEKLREVFATDQEIEKERLIAGRIIQNLLKYEFRDKYTIQIVDSDNPKKYNFVFSRNGYTDIILNVEDGQIHGDNLSFAQFLNPEDKQNLVFPLHYDNESLIVRAVEDEFMFRNKKEEIMRGEKDPAAINKELKEYVDEWMYWNSGKTDGENQSADDDDSDTQQPDTESDEDE